MKITNFQTIYIAQTSEPSPSPMPKREQEGVNLLGASWVPFWQTIVCTVKPANIDHLKVRVGFLSGKP
ncbi:hypothetical protein [Nostoc sp. KVJ20]|uniref:hypothetical protein n=1 Tax=Nostoc sp. KVJ20 TaxID=457944 RepID=UPI00114C9070|nr:hypothetical protein [Nostoc sp. KVJ20]